MIDVLPELPAVAQWYKSKYWAEWIGRVCGQTQLNADENLG
jgi:hypothetical protein